MWFVSSLFKQVFHISDYFLLIICVWYHLSVTIAIVNVICCNVFSVAVNTTNLTPILSDTLTGRLDHLPPVLCILCPYLCSHKNVHMSIYRTICYFPFSCFLFAMCFMGLGVGMGERWVIICFNEWVAQDLVIVIHYTSYPLRDITRPKESTSRHAERLCIITQSIYSSAVALNHLF